MGDHSLKFFDGFGHFTLWKNFTKNQTN